MQTETHLTLVLAELVDGVPKTCERIAADAGLTKDQTTKRLHELRREGIVGLVGVEPDTGRRLYRLTSAINKEAAPATTPAALEKISATQAKNQDDIARRYIADMASAARAAQEAVDAYVDHLAETDPVLRALVAAQKAIKHATPVTRNLFGVNP